MSDPFNYPFLRKDNTMYLSTICTPPSIQPSKIFTRSSSPSTASHPSCSMISQALPPKCSYPRAQHLLILHWVLSWSLFLIAVSISIRPLIPSSWRISRGLVPRQSSSRANAMWTHCVPSIRCPQLVRSCLIMVVVLFVTPCRSVTSMEKGTILGRIGVRRSCVSPSKGAALPNWPGRVRGCLDCRWRISIRMAFSRPPAIPIHWGRSTNGVTMTIRAWIAATGSSEGPNRDRSIRTPSTRPITSVWASRISRERRLTLSSRSLTS